ncbi:hypothetical protein, partial [Siminovitchia fortis]|uniref:hypothetical protein n=1 Tax=Siminovitchia fortis TaxID=254758 RepID=UPI001C930469
DKVRSLVENGIKGMGWLFCVLGLVKVWQILVELMNGWLWVMRSEDFRWGGIDCGEMMKWIVRMQCLCGLSEKNDWYRI